jgi:hypothetical protein
MTQATPAAANVRMTAAGPASEDGFSAWVPAVTDHDPTAIQNSANSVCEP